MAALIHVKGGGTAILFSAVLSAPTSAQQSWLSATVSIDNIAGIAKALQVEPWKLLRDD
jgi:hypothetical protein